MLRPLFWDYNFAELCWKEDRDLITSRVLSAGDWESVKWLRKRLGDDALRVWIFRREGRGLSRKQLRFWELLLRLPHDQVNVWLAAKERQVWDRRTRL